MPRSQAKAIYQQAIKSKAELDKLSQKIDKQKAPDVSATTTQPENIALQQMKTLEEKKRAELADLNFLLRFPELCPRELALQYAPVYNLPEDSDEGTKHSSKKCTKTRRKRHGSLLDGPKPVKRLDPMNKFEEAVASFNKSHRAISIQELSWGLLHVYGLTDLGELLSVLKREYGVKTGEEVIQEIEPLFAHYKTKIPIHEFIEKLKRIARVLDPPRKRDDYYHNDYLDHAKWEPANRFEQFMVEIGNQYAFTDYRQVGPCLMRIYGDHDERLFITHILEEYGYTWGQYDQMSACINILSHHLKPVTATTKYVKAWLYFFHQRFWFLAGKPENSLNDDIPDIPFNGDYEFRSTDGIWIPRMDYDPDYKKECMARAKRVQAKHPQPREEVPKAKIPDKDPDAGLSDTQKEFRRIMEALNAINDQIRVIKKNEEGLDPKEVNTRLKNANRVRKRRVDELNKFEYDREHPVKGVLDTKYENENQGKTHSDPGGSTGYKRTTDKSSRPVPGLFDHLKNDKP